MRSSRMLGIARENGRVRKQAPSNSSQKQKYYLEFVVFDQAYHASHIASQLLP